jgi:hypothetical protein
LIVVRVGIARVILRRSKTPRLRKPIAHARNVRGYFTIGEITDVTALTGNASQRGLSRLVQVLEYPRGESQPGLATNLMEALPT